MIRGNNENYILRFWTGEAPLSWKESKQWAFTRWMYQHMDPEALDNIASLPEQLVINMPGTDPIRVVHGSHRDPSESILPHRDPQLLDMALSHINEPVLVCGHTHLPWARERNGRLALNPGSVGAPLNGDVRAQYP